MHFHTGVRTESSEELYDYSPPVSARQALNLWREELFYALFEESNDEIALMVDTARLGVTVADIVNHGANLYYAGRQHYITQCSCDHN